MFAKEAVFFISGFLVFGSLNTLCTKLQFSILSVGLDGELHPFSKPYFGSYRMFLAMFLVLLGYSIGGTLFPILKSWITEYKQRFFPISSKKRRMSIGKADSNLDLDQGLLHHEKRNSSSEPFYLDHLLPVRNLTRKEFCFIGIPAVFDLTASTCSFIGLLYITASTWQMLRGSMIIFNSILFVLFLGRKMYCYNWAGVGCCTIGILLVGSAGIMGAADTTTFDTDNDYDYHTKSGSSDLLLKLFGVSLVIFGQFIQAGQVVVEERILKSNETPLPPAIVVGLEGIWGLLILTFIGFPILYFIPGNDYGGSMENLKDTFVMISNSLPLQMVIFVYLCSCSLYNFCGMSITKYLNSVHRTMLDAWRTLFIWGFGLFYHYYVDAVSNFGETWNNTWSWVQLFGFGMLIFGQLVYGGLVRFESLFYYPDSATSNKSKPYGDIYEDLEDSDVIYAEFISPCSTLNLVSPMPLENPTKQERNSYSIEGRRGSRLNGLVEDSEKRPNSNAEETVPPKEIAATNQIIDTVITEVVVQSMEECKRHQMEECKKQELNECKKQHAETWKTAAEKPAPAIVKEVPAASSNMNEAPVTNSKAAKNKNKRNKKKLQKEHLLGA